MSYGVYVAAPFEDALVVRALHARFGEYGLTPTAQWVNIGNGEKEDLAAAPLPSALAESAEKNDDDVRRSRAMLVLARPGAGGEMFAEARYAIVLGIPVYWVGRKILSAYRLGVIRCSDTHEALERLAAIARVAP